ncbi:hypothetical protein ASPWEDRAFT_48069 [Aspergillus wentii DTO 134E9]|uniref:Major facilitator superfamily (MFS) profile domain-containing protein n=1 Tax=Aspergillus wentii DTO 134E9 TaxID=1073089 RepID=A0A1L9S2W3_ASPWE|nr:uncharacterized protein ASPWEDRAFT_48069 [Aspergillus wentii DTO 134E9]OJJ41505.1 hypothetical protein ASPWEDRAFT_48069 [Aspergillus wentii DTO 134E9]
MSDLNSDTTAEKESAEQHEHEHEHEHDHEVIPPNLRRVCDDISPWVYLVAVVELAERFTYRSITAPMQNYIQYTRDDLRPGALGRGQSVATGINYFYSGWCYLTPIFGAIIADSYLGRFRTIWLGTGIMVLGSLILFLTSLEPSLDHGAGMPGLMVSLVLIGIGTGCITSNVNPLIAEQYTERRERVKMLDSGEMVVVDPHMTLTTMYGRYFLIINVGALSVIPASWLELKVAFWASFLLSLCFWTLPILALVIGRNRYVVHQPRESPLVKASKVLYLRVRHGSFDSVKALGACDQGFVEELKRALVACRVFPIFWICYGQTNSNIVSQAATMQTFGIPNDMMGFFNPISAFMLVPLMERVVYPTLQRWKMPFKPITRITVGFLAMACAIAYAAGIQHLIYTSPPCYDTPLGAECSQNGKLPNQVNVFLQLPIHALTSLSEILAYVSGLEYAYTKAPKSMKSIVTSIFLVMFTVGCALGITLSPVSKDPKVLVEYASLSGVMVVTAGVFWMLFNKYNEVEEKMNQM